MRVLDVLFAFRWCCWPSRWRRADPGGGDEIISITIVLIPYVGRLARTATLAW